MDILPPSWICSVERTNLYPVERVEDTDGWISCSKMENILVKWDDSLYTYVCRSTHFSGPNSKKSCPAFFSRCQRRCFHLPNNEWQPLDYSLLQDPKKNRIVSFNCLLMGRKLNVITTQLLGGRQVFICSSVHLLITLEWFTRGGPWHLLRLLLYVREKGCAEAHE